MRWDVADPEVLVDVGCKMKDKRARFNIWGGDIHVAVGI